MVKMRKARIMHVETSLLDGVGELRASEGHVLQNSGETAIIVFGGRGRCKWNRRMKQEQMSQNRNRCQQ